MAVGSEPHSDPCNQLRNPERLAHIVDGTAIEALYRSPIVVDSGQHEHGGIHPLVSPPLDYFEAQQAGHELVEDDQVVIAVSPELVGGQPVVCHVHFVPGAVQGSVEQGSYGLRIVGNEDFRFLAHHERS